MRTWAELIAVGLLWLGVPLQVQGAGTPADASEHRYVFAVETSRRMKPMLVATRAALYELVANGAQREMQPGDVLELWTFNEQVRRHDSLPLAWAPELNLRLAQYAFDFLGRQRFEKTVRWAALRTELDQLARRVPHLTVLLLTCGETAFSDLPFESELSAARQRRSAAVQRSGQPFILALVAADGQWVDYALNTANEAVHLSRPRWQSTPVSRDSAAPVPEAPPRVQARVETPLPPALAPPPAPTAASVSTGAPAVTNPPSVMPPVQAEPRAASSPVGATPPPAPVIATSPTPTAVVGPASAAEVETRPAPPPPASDRTPIAPVASVQIVSTSAAPVQTIAEAPRPAPPSSEIKPIAASPPSALPPQAPTTPRAPEVTPATASPPAPVRPEPRAAPLASPPEPPAQAPDARAMAVVVPPQEQGIQWPYLVLGAMLLASAVGLFYWLWQSRHAHSRLSLISQSLDQKGGENPTSPPANSSPGARPD